MRQIKPEEIKPNGRRIRKPEESSKYGTHLSPIQKEAIANAHRKPVICLDNGKIFKSCKEAALWCNSRFPEIISRAIKTNNPNKTAFGLHWSWYKEQKY